MLGGVRWGGALLVAVLCFVSEWVVGWVGRLLVL